ncbi:MAG: 4Fe-4S binding protein [Candidatus Cloacimonadaceae bacterium]|nr:4Fe-4S binding protein [Candidatus Cloacimonadaceae bacterium]MDP3113396.1 4Fe-4S binding protein [Candidatus Cloacimonadaceae bacterium]
MNTRKTLVIIALSLLAVLFVSIACKRVTITEYNVDSSSCNGCGECIRVCPSDAIFYDVNNKAVIDQSKCTRCAECVAACPNNAIY